MSAITAVAGTMHERFAFAPVAFRLESGGKGQCFADETGKVDAAQATARCVERYVAKEGLISGRIKEEMRGATSV